MGLGRSVANHGRYLQGTLAGRMWHGAGKRSIPKPLTQILSQPACADTLFLGGVLCVCDVKGRGWHSRYCTRTEHAGAAEIHHPECRGVISHQTAHVAETLGDHRWGPDPGAAGVGAVAAIERCCEVQQAETGQPRERVRCVSEVAPTAVTRACYRLVDLFVVFSFAGSGLESLSWTIKVHRG